MFHVHENIFHYLFQLEIMKKKTIKKIFDYNSLNVSIIIIHINLFAYILLCYKLDPKNVRKTTFQLVGEWLGISLPIG